MALGRSGYQGEPIQQKDNTLAFENATTAEEQLSFLLFFHMYFILLSGRVNKNHRVSVFASLAARCQKLKGSRGLCSIAAG